MASESPMIRFGQSQTPVSAICGLAHIQVGIGKAEMRFAVIRITLDGCFEIRRGRLRLVQIVQHIAAIHIRGNHIRITLQGLGEVLACLIQLPIMLVHIAGQQGNIRLFRQNVDRIAEVNFSNSS